MRGGFSARNFDIVMMIDAILIAVAALLVILAYREIHDAPVRDSKDLAATVMAMSDDLASDDGLSGMRLDADGTLSLLRRIEVAKAELARGRENAELKIFSDHINLSEISEEPDEFRQQALVAIRGGQESQVEAEVNDGGRFVRIAAPLLAAADCGSCAETGATPYKRGDIIGIREIVIPVADGFATTVKKLLYAFGMLAVSLMVFLGIIIPMIKRSRQEKAQFHTLAASLEVQATTDPLTGLHNRRYFEQALEEYLAEFNSRKSPLGLLVFDLDHFKKVNDTHGHDAGDMVLREVALRLRAITRDNDVVARIGGEEFAVITPYATTEQLMNVAERYRTMISALNVQIGKVVLKPTISIGVATNSDGTDNAHDFFKAADRKLYQAKREGRNRVAA
jgi:two-component system cell cycle response regulator